METKTNYPDEIVSAGQLLRILDTDASEVSSLCQKACLRPKKDGFGNVYFSKGDVDVLRKVKELYEQTKKIQEERRSFADKNAQDRKKLSKKNEKPEPVRFEFEENLKKEQKSSLMKKDKEEKLYPAKETATALQAAQAASSALMEKIDSVENNVISKLTDVLSEKLDGLDEVIVELIKTKTENENLRQKVNELNKENFALKSENAAFKPVGLGLYVKKAAQDNFTF